MEDNLNQFVDHSLVDVCNDIALRRGIAKESKNPYYFIEIIFKNGYSLRVFPNNEGRWIIGNLLSNSD